MSGNVFYMDWEVSLIEWLQKNLGDAGIAVSKVITAIGGETIAMLVLIVVLFCYSKEAGKRVGLTLLAANAWYPMIKNVVLRLRPYMVHENISVHQLVEADASPTDVLAQGYSFPSGHSASAASMYGSIAREIRKKWMWILAVILPLLIGISRFIVGVHYPTDVLAGWAVGLAAVGFAILLEKKVPNDTHRFLILLVMTLPGLFWCSSRDYFSTLGMLAGMTAAVPYEKKYVRFADTRKIPVMILRTVGAFAAYYVLNTVLKLPFGNEFLNSGTLDAHLVRSLRYAVILFVLFAVYPRCFPFLERLFPGKDHPSGKAEA